MRLGCRGVRTNSTKWHLKLVYHENIRRSLCNVGLVYSKDATNSTISKQGKGKEARGREEVIKSFVKHDVIQFRDELLFFH